MTSLWSVQAADVRKGSKIGCVCCQNRPHEVHESSITIFLTKRIFRRFQNLECVIITLKNYLKTNNCTQTELNFMSCGYVYNMLSQTAVFYSRTQTPIGWRRVWMEQLQLQSKDCQCSNQHGILFLHGGMVKNK